MSPKGNSETHNDSAHASINTDTKQSDNVASNETSTASNKGKSTKKTIDFSKLFADDLEHNRNMSIAAGIIFILIAVIIYFEIRESIIHLEEVQKLIKAPENTPNEILETINEIRNTFSLLGLFLIILIIAFVSCFAKMIMDFLDKYPQRVFVATASLGGILAFSIPQYLYSFKFIGETKDITTSLLTVTGGILAVFTLLKTHQKNETDEKKFEHEKIVHDEQKKDREEDIRIQKRQFNKTIKQESYKFYKERIRQVHTERRSRYTKAIEQLTSNKGAIRLGGIYTLVGLVDEWLADDALEQEERQKEGQVIINNLCSYIRSPFPLAAKTEYFQFDVAPAGYTGDFVTDQAAFREEQDVRRTIFAEMSKRSSTFTKNEKGEMVPSPSTWSDFEFDFSRAPIFYPLNNLTIEKAIFSSARFYGEANFCETSFAQSADFSNTRFNQKANFYRVTFYQSAIFQRAKFIQEADFDFAKFNRDVNFLNTIFNQSADFTYTTFNEYELTGSTPGFLNAWFSAQAEPKDYDFSNIKGDPLQCITATLLNKSFFIPLGSRLFDPNSWNENTHEYDTRSELPSQLKIPFFGKRILMNMAPEANYQAN